MLARPLKLTGMAASPNVDHMRVWRVCGEWHGASGHKWLVPVAWRKEQMCARQPRTTIGRHGCRM